jgi:hypothetical protein
VFRAANDSTVLIDDDEVGMGELQLAVEPRHLASEDASGAPVQLTVPVPDQPRLPEERAGQGALTVSDRDL